MTADKNEDGEIDFDECVKLLKKLNAGMKKKYIKQIFNVSKNINFLLKSELLNMFMFVSPPQMLATTVSITYISKISWLHYQEFDIILRKDSNASL